MSDDKSRRGLNPDGSRSRNSPTNDDTIMAHRGVNTLAFLRKTFGNRPIPDVGALSGDYHEGHSSVCVTQTRLCTAETCKYFPSEQCRAQEYADRTASGLQTIHVAHDRRCPDHPDNPSNAGGEVLVFANRAERRRARRQGGAR